MQDFDKAIGQRCRLLRERSGYTQKEIAKCLKVTPQQVQKYENGVNRISAQALFTLKQLYQVEWKIFFKDCYPYPIKTPCKQRRIKDANYYVEQIPSAEARRAVLGILKELSEQYLVKTEKDNPDE